MDKRLFLALLLTALVVVMTPVVFPTSRPVRPSVGDTSAISAVPDRSDTIGSTLPQSERRAEPRALGPASSATRQSPRDTTSAPMPVAAETTIVRGGGSTYRFLNLGATP